MDTLQTSQFYDRRPRIAGQSGLPPGVRQVDCDGPPDPLQDASGNQLWNACDSDRQELISTRFAEIHSDLVRDILLDVQDAPRSLAADANGGRETLLGRLLWPKWICFRDRMLREMLHRGELAGA